MIKRPAPPGGYNGWSFGSNSSGQLGTGEKKGEAAAPGSATSPVCPAQASITRLQSRSMRL